MYKRNQSVTNKTHDPRNEGVRSLSPDEMLNRKVELNDRSYSGNPTSKTSLSALQTDGRGNDQ